MWSKFVSDFIASVRAVCKTILNEILFHSTFDTIIDAIGYIGRTYKTVFGAACLRGVVTNLPEPFVGQGVQGSSQPRCPPFSIPQQHWDIVRNLMSGSEHLLPSTFA